MRALIVDDDEHMRGLLEIVVQNHGLVVTAVATAEEGWEAYSRRDFGLVVLDWMLPGMDGVELCRKMRASPRGRGSVILLVTARRGPSDLKSVLDAGADDYIAKPVSADELSVRIAIAARSAHTLAARARAESALRESERRLGVVVSSAPVTIFGLDEHGRSTLARGSVLRDTLGLAADPVGVSFPELLVRFPDAKAAIGAALRGEAGTALVEQDGRVVELRLTPVSDEDGETRVNGVATDITDRVRMAEQLRDSLQRLEQANADIVAVLDRLPTGTAVVDDRGCLGYVSSKAAEFFRVDPKGVLGRAWDKALPFPEEDLRRLRLASAAAPADRSPVQARVVHSDGASRSLKVEIFDDPRDPKRSILIFNDESEVHDLRALLDEKATFHDLVGKTPQMQAVYDHVRDFAGVNWTVLIEGETGTGKELIARAIHNESPRRNQPFVPVNCAGLSVSLLQSQLFGHRKGAFTGATTDQAGYFEAADGGTLFLDEIGDISREVQVSLLRVLEEGEITRVGESVPRKVDVRVITATHRHLPDEVEAGNFRADLMYRIRVARIELPPLRARRADIPLLVNRFLSRARAATAKEIVGVSDEAMAALLEYDWPGNVRELRSAIDFAVVRSRTTTVDKPDLPPELQVVQVRTGSVPLVAAGDAEARIRSALVEAGGNRTKAARILGISRATFYRRLTELDMGV